MPSKYEILVNILDKIVHEAPPSEKTYHPSSVEERNHARSLGLIHLFLKSKFGLMTFKERNQYVTDGGGDGGMDCC